MFLGRVLFQIISLELIRLETKILLSQNFTTALQMTILVPCEFDVLENVCSAYRFVMKYGVTVKAITSMQ